VSATHVVVAGTLRADGSLELDGKLNLPPGRVQLIVQPLPELPKDDPFWQMMRQIWAARTVAELAPRGTEDVEGRRRALRDEVDQEIEKARRLQEERAAPPRRREDTRGKAMMVCLGAKCSLSSSQQQPHCGQRDQVLTSRDSPWTICRVMIAKCVCMTHLNANWKR
jgi:hypothetical protein